MVVCLSIYPKKSLQLYLASMNSKSLSSNPCRKTSFTRRFLRALAEIRREEPNSSSHVDISRRCQRIKVAAYASMASAVGSKRAWSRAMICKVRNRAICRASMRQKIKISKWKKAVANKHRRDVNQEDELRRLVPGGKSMDFCKLLEETAHYIKSLTTQVQVMRSIADYYST
uniref:IBH1-like N-terminal domain-containing protein n=1 Tax=Nelumbo nucifera TaxID=4432 RepID=A0A822XV85_NELNU|nr:TPA_asm: hypothetical protein HUJ06_025710 [Nelumbo nucifera]